MLFDTSKANIDLENKKTKRAYHLGLLCGSIFTVAAYFISINFM